MAIETIQIQSITPEPAASNHGRGLGLWLAHRLCNRAPIASNEYSQYVGWLSTQGAYGPVPERIWWQVLTAVLCESAADWNNGKLERIRPTVPSSGGTAEVVID